MSSMSDIERSKSSTSQGQEDVLCESAPNVETEGMVAATHTGCGSAQPLEGVNNEEESPPSPAPDINEVVTESAPEVEPAIAEPAAFTEPPRVESCEPVESPVAEAASPKLAVGNLAVTTEREQKELDYAAKNNPQKATIEKMRGERGPIFESHAAVLRGNSKPGVFKLILQCCWIERDFVTYSEVRRYIMIKSKYLFVFHDASATAPLYAVPLGHIQAHLEDPENPSEESYTLSPTGGRNEAGKGLQTVLLREPLDGEEKGKVYYQVTFNEKDTKMPDAATRFVEIINSDSMDQSGSSASFSLKESPSNKRQTTKSVKYAEAVAESKVKHQPMQFSSS